MNFLKHRWKDVLMITILLVGFIVINIPSFEVNATLLINEGLIIQLITVTIIVLPLLYFSVPSKSMREGFVWGFLAILYTVFFFLTQNTISVIANTEAIMAADGINCQLVTQIQSKTPNLIPAEFSTSVYDDNTGLINYQFSNVASQVLDAANQMKLANELIELIHNNPQNLQTVNNLDQLLLVPANDISTKLCDSASSGIASTIDQWNSTTTISALFRIFRDYLSDFWIGIKALVGR